MTTTSSLLGFTNRSNTTASFPTTSTKILYTNDVRTITAIFSLLIVVGVYLTVSLIIFSRRVKYVQDIVCQKNSAAKERFFVENIVSALLLLSAVITLVRYAVVLVELYTGREKSKYNDVKCTWLSRFKAALGLITRLCVYSVMWIRQRNFNKNLSLQGAVSTKHNIISGIVMVFLVSTFVLGIVLVFTVRKFEGSLQGCRIVANDDRKRFFTFLTHFIFTILFQLLLISLLIYPLIKYRKDLERMDTDQKLHLKVLKKLVICTSVEIIFNGVMLAISQTIPADAHNLYRQFIYDIDNLVLFLCVLVSFSDWKDRLLSMCSYFGEDDS